MSSGPNNSDDGPDFSFLGEQAVPDAGDMPEFGDAPTPSDVSDVSEFPDLTDVDATAKSPPPTDTTDPQPAADDRPSEKAVERKKVRATKRVKPKVRKVARAAQDVAADSSVASTESATAVEPETDAVMDESSKAVDRTDVDGVSRKTFSIVAGYAAALTLLMLGLLLSGRISLSGGGVLESLPDVQPLKSNEFQEVPDSLSLPDSHSLRLGESRRFGDVVLTPTKVTREPVTFTNMMNGSAVEGMSSKPVLKLWFRMENASSSVAFPPWDVALMSHRSEKAGSVVANSWLKIQETGADTETRILNFYHSPDSNLDLTAQNSRKLVSPGQEITSFVASSEDISHIVQEKAESYRWRIQIRKGVHLPSGNGVTTLVEVNFLHTDIGA